MVQIRTSVTKMIGNHDRVDIVRIKKKMDKVLGAQHLQVMSKQTEIYVKYSKILYPAKATRKIDVAEILYMQIYRRKVEEKYLASLLIN